VPWLPAVDIHYATAGFLVGALVGITGVGGGSLMTPVLILLFGLAPATAVGTDLLFAAATKTVGSLVHGLNHTIEWRLVALLACGSLPATLVALLVLSSLHMSAGGARELITGILALALFMTAGLLVAREGIVDHYAALIGRLNSRSIASLTVAMGAIVGALVTFSSVGAGAIGVTVLLMLYPRIPAARIVGSDIAHAVPLTLIAGVGHGAMDSLDLRALGSLLAGSLPGIFLSSSISPRIPERLVRYALAIVLFIVAARLAVSLVAGSRS
jgi:uncharacterized membrane protein YfcA